MKRMTPDIEASRRIDRDHAGGLHGSCMASICAERHFLLAEVDRLTASGPAQVTAAWNWAIEHERVRILAEVEGLDIYPGSRGREVAGGYVRRAAVIAAIKGEATE